MDVAFGSPSTVRRSRSFFLQHLGRLGEQLGRQLPVLRHARRIGRLQRVEPVGCLQRVTVVLAYPAELGVAPESSADPLGTFGQVAKQRLQRVHRFALRRAGGSPLVLRQSLLLPQRRRSSLIRTFGETAPYRLWRLGRLR